jgi:starch phosphorylase
MRSLYRRLESVSLYNILEKEVKPAFYTRGLDGLPKEWLKRIRESMKSLNPVFNTNRMVKNYTENYYGKAHRNYIRMSEDNHRVSRELAQWRQRIHDKWTGVSIMDMSFHGKMSQGGHKITVTPCQSSELSHT